MAQLFITTTAHGKNGAIVDDQYTTQHQTLAEAKRMVAHGAAILLNTNCKRVEATIRRKMGAAPVFTLDYAA